MLHDKVNITIKSGNGGNGSLSRDQEFIDGGDGGKGGNVYLRGNENLYDLTYFDNGKVYEAARGNNGKGRKKTGSNGEDIILDVPILTEVHVGNRVPFKVAKNKELVEVLSGGEGGFGNLTQRKLSITQPNKVFSFEGEPGKTKNIELVLKLQSDIIFIGYPNAGKSSLLNELCGANVKTAPYAFTTLEPQLGIMDGITLMDLPGLIEGTFEGKGLGTKFVKHTESSKLVAHMISMENEDLIATYKTLRAELKQIDEKLYSKPEVVILTKSDEASIDDIKNAQKQFKKIGLETAVVSIIDENSLTNLKNLFKNLMAQNAGD